MRQVFKRIRQEGTALVDAHLKYKAHVCKQTYDSVENWTEEERNRVETAWPTYAGTYDMLARGAYTTHAEEDGDAEWLKKYRAHVETVQRHRQHHVHQLIHLAIYLAISALPFASRQHHYYNSFLTASERQQRPNTRQTPSCDPLRIFHLNEGFPMKTVL